MRHLLHVASIALLDPESADLIQKEQRLDGVQALLHSNKLNSEQAILVVGE